MPVSNGGRKRGETPSALFVVVAIFDVLSSHEPTPFFASVLFSEGVIYQGAWQAPSHMLSLMRLQGLGFDSDSQGSLLLIPAFLVKDKSTVRTFDASV